MSVHVYAIKFLDFGITFSHMVENASDHERSVCLTRKVERQNAIRTKLAREVWTVYLYSERIYPHSSVVREGAGNRTFEP